MKYRIYHIPSMIVPEAVYKIDEMKIVIFPSKCENPIGKFDSPPQSSSLGIFLYSETEMDPPLVLQVLDEVVTMINVFHIEASSYEWLHSANPEQSPSFDTKDVSKVVEENLSPAPRGFNGLHDFRMMSVVGYTSKQDFIRCLINYHNLDSQDETRHLVKLLSVLPNLDSYLGRIYDNVNLRMSLLYTIYDKLMKKETIEVSSECPKCGEITIRQGKKKDKDRIRQFVSDQYLSTEYSDLLTKFLNELSTIRNDFYHEGNFVDLNQRWTMHSSGGATLVDDIEQNGGRILGQFFGEDIVRGILLGRLIERSDYIETPKEL